MTLASLRKSIAIVSQEVTLFDDTIRANIALGRLGASDGEHRRRRQGSRRARVHHGAAARATTR